MKKFILFTLLSIFMLSCADDSWKQELEEIKAELANQKALIEALQKNSTITSIEQGEGKYTIHFSDGQSITLSNGKTPVITIGENGNWFINGVDTGKPSQGNNGTDGQTPTIEIGKNGNWIINGTDTGIKAEGIDGTDGQTPNITIGENGNWFINGVDTGKPSQGNNGTDGQTPTIEIGENGNWIINGTDTGIKAEGIDGTDGQTPNITIGENGNWYINGVDTGKPSQGEDGTNGTNGTDGKNPTIEIGINGNWIINGTDTGIKAEGTNGKDAPYIVSIIEYQTSIIFIFSDSTSITCLKSSNNYTIKKYKLPTTDYSLAQYEDNGGDIESTLNGPEYPAILDRISGEINPIFRYDVPMRQAANNYPVYDAVKQNTKRAMGYSIDFIADCQYIEFKGYPSFQVVVIADNVIVTDIIKTDHTGGYRYIKIDLKNRKRRHIKVYITGLFMGVKTESGGKIEKYIENKLLALFDGDSIVEGTGSTFTPAYGWPSITSQILNWDCLNCGVGASGYIKIGNQGEPNMPNRFDTYIKPYNPDILVVSAGLNDPASTETKEAIFTYWQKVKNELPNTIIIVVSPFSPVEHPNESLLQITEWCRIAALENKLPYIDIVNGKTYDELGNLVTDNTNGPIHGIISGTGNAGSSVDPNDGNRFEYISSDNTHPTKEGHQYIGERISQEIYKLLR